MLDSGQMPPYCPACRTEAMSEGHSEPMHGRIEGKALSFLEQEGVLTKDFQFRMLRQMEENEGERFFACPAKCGRYLIDQDPQYAMVPRGATSDAGFDRKMRLGKCECGAHVCCNCHQQAEKTVSASGEEEYSHTCPTALNRDAPTDEATLELLKSIGKKCPNCGNWIQKNDGCNVMMCGTEAHGRLSDALARGGCGFLFYWYNDAFSICSLSVSLTLKASPLQLGHPRSGEHLLHRAGRQPGSSKFSRDTWCS